jgi:hypothetical protein
LGKARYYGEFEPLSLPAQQVKLAQRLRAERYLLILDNLESITGRHLAIRHTLPEEEREALREFLSALAGGKTLVLLGSRGGEEWLAPDTFGGNVYDLPGLDPEAASTLAERVLERHGAKKYRQDPDLEKLLKLLDGYPLPIEVVLANLARQTPAEVLAALEAGDVALDKGGAQDKTESILRCIDYSHSNLSPEAQGLLVCLAPFTGVVNTQVLPQYTEALRKQSELAQLPFERWPEVLREAVNWGLMSPIPEAPDILRLQPVFPYFLRGRLNAPGQTGIKAAMEAAFREQYDTLAEALAGLLLSKDAQEKQLGQWLMGMEYENVHTALHLALTARVSILSPYGVISLYLDAAHDERRGLELDEAVLAFLEKYPPEALTGQLGVELGSVIDDMGKRQLLLKQYAAAETSYQKALSIWQASEYSTGWKPVASYSHWKWAVPAKAGLKPPA